jgi:hypothetical protein
MPEESNQSKFENYSLSFDGTGYVEGVSDSDTLNNLTSLSVSMWLNQADVASFKYYLSIGNYGGSPSDFLELYSHGTASRSFNVEGSIATSGFQSFDFSSFVSNNTWFHLVLVWDSTQSTATDRIKIYIDGILRGSLSGVTSTFDTNGETKIGRTWRNTSNTFSGKMDYCSIFDYALTQAQVNYLYNSGTPQNPMAISGNAPIAYYPLGGGSTGDAAVLSPSTLTVPNESVPSATVFDFNNSEIINCGYLDFLSNATKATFSFWLNRETSYPNQVFGVQSSSSDRMGFVLQSDNTAAFHINSIVSSISNFITSNGWYHIVIVWDASESTASDRVKIYLNNSATSCGNASNPSSFSAMNADFKLGQFSSQYLTGLLSNFQIWNTNLSGPEISTLYNYGSPLSGTQPQAANLKAWYKMGIDTSNWDMPLGISNNWEIGDSTSGFAHSFFTNQTSFVNNVNVIPIDHDSINNISEEITISMWIKTTYSGAYTNSYFILRDQVGGTARNFYLAKDNWYPGSTGQYAMWSVFNSSNASLGANMRTGTTAPDGSPYIAIADGKWHQVVGTYASDTISLYIDGVLQNSNTSVGFGNIKTGVKTTILGRNYSTPNQGYNNGYNSNAQIWDKALTAGEVTTLYNSGKPINTLLSIPQHSNLKGWWALDNTATYNEGASTFSIPDKSGNSNNVTGVGMTQSVLQPGMVSALNGTSSGMTTANLVNSDLTRSIPYSSYSMTFDGTSNEYINCGHAALTAISGGSNTLSTSMSVSMWFKLGSSSSSRGLINFGSLGNTYGGFTIRHQSSVFSFLKESTHLVSGGYTFTNTSEWHHMAFVYDPSSASNCYLYIDGVDTGVSFVNVGNLSFQNSNLTNRNLIIGAYYGDADTFTGSISNCSIYNKLLTTNQVLTIYNGGVPNDISSLSPTGWWSLGGDSYFNGNDFICPDLSSNSNNGTSSGMGGTELVGSGPGSTANGTATGMNIPANLQGNAPNSTKNAFSINMAANDKTSSVPDISS